MWRKSYTQYIAYLLILCFGLAACAPPQANQTGGGRDFKIQQTSEEEILDPVDTMPTVPDPDDEIEIIAKELDVPIKYTMKRAYPKNTSLQLPDAKLTPVQRKPIALQPYQKEQLKKASKESMTAWSKWLRDLYHFTLNEGSKQLRNEMTLSREQYLKERILLEAPHKKEQRTHLSKTYLKAQKAQQEKLNQFRKDLKAAYDKDQANLESYILQQYGQGDFKIQCADPFTCFVGGVAASIFGIVAVAVGVTAVVVAGAIIVGQVRLGEAIGQGIVNFMQQNPPPPKPQPTLPPKVDPTDTRTVPTTIQLAPKPNLQSQSNIDNNAFPVFVNDAQGQLPQALSQSTVLDALVQEADRLRKANEMIADIQKVLNENPDAQYSASNFRLGPILKSLGIPIDDSRFAACQQNPGQITLSASNCDYAFVAIMRAAENGFRTQSINNPISIAYPDYFSLYQAEDKVEVSLIFNKTNGATATLTQWLQELVDVYYSHDPNREQYKTQIAEKLNEHTFEFEVSIKPDQVCKQGVDRAFSSSELSSFRSLLKAKNFIMDGDYTFRLNAWTSNSAEPQLLAEALIPQLTRKMGMAPHQRLYGIQQSSEYTDRNELFLPNTQAVVDYPPPLRMMDLFSASDTVPSNLMNYYQPDGFGATNYPYIGIRLENDTANLWDLNLSNISKLSTGEICAKQLFKADCVDSAGTEYRLNPYRYESGLYRVKTQYSTATDKKGNPVPGVKPDQFSKLSPDSKSQNYDFINLKGEYSTFARMSNHPEATELKGQFTNANTQQTTTVDFLQGIHTIEDIEDSDGEGLMGFSPLPDVMPDVFSLNNPLQINYASKVFLNGVSAQIRSKENAKYVLNGPSNAQDIQSSSLRFGLYSDLVKNSPSTMQQLNISPDSEKKYLNVGSIVNLSNLDANKNRALRLQQANQTQIPMLLQVVEGKYQGVSSGSQSVLASWPFQAQIGTFTIVQRYWDGTSKTLEDGLYRPALPTYSQGDYHIRVLIDRETIQTQRSLTSLRNLYDGAYMTYPVLSNQSSRVNVNIPQDIGTVCSELKEFVEPLEQLDQELSQTDYEQTSTWLESGFQVASVDFQLASAEVYAAKQSMQDIQQYMRDVIEHCKSCSESDILKKASDVSSKALLTLKLDWIKEDVRLKNLKAASMAHVLAAGIYAKRATNSKLTADPLAKAKLIAKSIDNADERQIATDLQAEQLIRIQNHFNAIVEVAKDELKQPIIGLTKEQIRERKEFLASLVQDLDGLRQELAPYNASFGIAQLAAAPALVFATTNPVGLTIAIVALSAILINTGAILLAQELNRIDQQKAKEHVAQQSAILTAQATIWDSYEGKLDLGKNLEGEKRKYYDAPHHIIQKAKEFTRLETVRRYARQCLPPDAIDGEKYGIDSKESGMWADPLFHGKLHTNISRENIKKLLEDAFEKGQCQAFNDVLKKIKDCLKSFNAEWEKAILDYIYQAAQKLGWGNGPYTTKQIYKLRHSANISSGLKSSIANNPKLKLPKYITTPTKNISVANMCR